MNNNEREVYVTASNHNKVKKAYVDLILALDEPMKNKIYKEDLSWIFSYIEMKYLFAEVLIALNGDGYKLEENCITRNNRTHLFDGGAPKYHFDKECKYSKKPYTNFEIPPEIASRGKEEVEKFKKFANENKDLKDKDEREFLKKLESRFMLKNPPKKVEYSNSGIEEFTRLSLEEMEEEIDKRIAECKSVYNSNKNIKDTTFAPKKKIVNSEIYGEDVKKWHSSHKSELNEMIKIYIREREGSGFHFRKGFLDSIGFEPCRACCEEIRF
jgi:hypothetical protein|tara:strand:- start:2110 stop:2919 length:810 start_codon:yes stop_codon:yes gene_type:complete